MAKTPGSKKMLSLGDIEDAIISRYATKFKTDPNTIFATTDLKTRFNFSAAAWANEAVPLSELFDVVIGQGEMNANTTVDKLTRLIDSKLNPPPAAPKPKAKPQAAAKGP